MSTGFEFDLDMRVKTEAELEIELDALALPVEKAKADALAAAQEAREAAGAAANAAESAMAMRDTVVAASGAAHNAAAKADEAAERVDAALENVDAGIARIDGAVALAGAATADAHTAKEAADASAASANASAQTALNAAQSAEQTAMNAAQNAEQVVQAAEQTLAQETVRVEAALAGVNDKANAVHDVSDRAMYHRLYAQQGAIDMVYYGKTVKGKGIVPIAVVSGRNLLDPAFFVADQTVNGVSFTGGKTGEISFSGTASASASFALYNNGSAPPYWCVRGMTYHIAANTTDPNVYLRVYVVSNSQYKTVVNGPSGSFTFPEDADGLSIRLQINAGITVSGKASPCLACVPDTSYEPYAGTTTAVHAQALYGDDELGVWDTLEMNPNTGGGILTHWWKVVEGAPTLLSEPEIENTYYNAIHSDGRLPVYVTSRNYTMARYTHDTKHYIDGQAVDAPSAPGTTFLPSVSQDGVLSWTNDGGLTNPEPVNIKGPAGSDANVTKQAITGALGYTPAKQEDVDSLSEDMAKQEEALKGKQPAGDYALKSEIPAPYTLPTASAEVKGGVKVGNGLQMTGDVLGIKPEQPMRLIKRLTVETPAAIVKIDKDDDDQPFAVKNVMVKITASEKISQSSLVTDGISAWAFISGSAFSDNGYMAIMVFGIRGGKVFLFNDSVFRLVGNSGAEGQITAYGTAFGMKQYDSINAIGFNVLNGEWPAGTMFELYELEVY